MMDKQRREHFDFTLSESELPEIFQTSIEQLKQSKVLSNFQQLSSKNIQKNKKTKKNQKIASEWTDQRQFQEDLQRTMKKIDKKFSFEINRKGDPSEEYHQDSIFEEDKGKNKFNQSIKAIFSEFEERRIEKQIIALTILNKPEFTLKRVREQFQKSKPGMVIERDKKRTLCHGVAVDFIRGLERFLVVECKVQLQPMKKDNVSFLTKVIACCKTMMTVEMSQLTLNFLKFVYDLGQVKLDPTSLLNLYKHLSQLSEELIVSKYQQNMQKKRPHELPIATYCRLQKSQTLQNIEQAHLSDLNRSWTQKHQSSLKTFYKQNQSFAFIREQFRQKYPEDYHLWTYSTIELRMQRLIRDCLKVLKSIAYQKTNTGLPLLINIDTQRTKMISLRVPFKQIRVRLIKLMENTKDMQNVAWLIQNINQQCRNWKLKKESQRHLTRQQGNEDDHQDFEEDLETQKFNKKLGKKSGKKL